MTTSNLTTDQEHDILDAQRTPEQKEALERLLKLAEEQGVRPLDLDALLAKADFWPEDESIDEFIATVAEWRSEGHDRELP
ncbi:MAG: hypothetical protein AABO57_05040 [Acidobacteriota bacterium]